MKLENLESINSELFQALALEEEEHIVGQSCPTVQTQQCFGACSTNTGCQLDIFCVSDCY
jgi:hypothetical protein